MEMGNARNIADLVRGYDDLVQEQEVLTGSIERNRTRLAAIMAELGKIEYEISLFSPKVAEKDLRDPRFASEGSFWQEATPAPKLADSLPGLEKEHKYEVLELSFGDMFEVDSPQTEIPRKIICMEFTHFYVRGITSAWNEVVFAREEYDTLCRAGKIWKVLPKLKTTSK